MFPKKSSLMFLANLNDNQSHRHVPIRRIISQVLYGCVLIAITLYIFWRAWQANSWFPWVYFYTLVFILLTPVLALAKAPLKGKINQNALIHAIASNGDLALAPEADEQPITFTDPTILPAQETIGIMNFVGIGSFNDVFAPPTTITANSFIPTFLLSAESNWYSLWFLLVFLILNSASTGSDLFGLRERLNEGPLLLLIPLLGFGSLISLLCIVFFPFYGWRKNLLITVDDIGIRWQKHGDATTAYRLEWRTIRAFVYAKIPQSQRFRDTEFTYTYMLINDDAMFVWGAKAGIDNRLAANYLANLAATRTGLKLRDMSAFANELAQTKNNDNKIAAVLAKHRAESSVSADIVHARDTRQPRWQSRLGKGAAQVAFVLVIGLVFIGIFANAQQHGYFAGLPAHFHAMRSTYQDALITPTGNWPIHVPTVTDQRGMRYTADGYQLYGTDQYQSIVAFGKPIFGDAAVEVTARVNQENAPDSAYAGIAVGSDSANYLLFSMQMDMIGFWYVNICPNASKNKVDCHHIDMSDLEISNDVNILHADDGAAKTLMVVMRQDAYVFYLNGTYIYTFVDAAHVLPEQHRIGFYTEGGGSIATYSDLNVYRITTPYFWAYA